MSDQPKQAFITEAFTPAEVGVGAQDPQPGQPAQIHLQLLIGPVAPGVFLHSKTVQLDANVAVQLGEHIAREGRRVRSGLIAATADQIPAK